MKCKSSNVRGPLTSTIRVLNAKESSEQLLLTISSSLATDITSISRSELMPSPPNDFRRKILCFA